MARSKDYGDIGSDTIDHSADEQLPPDPAPVAPDNATRLRELRAMREAGTLTPADNEEMARLSSAESEAAGHVIAEPPANTPAPDHPLTLHGDLVGLVEAIIDTLPALRSLRPQLDAIKNRLDLLLNPPDK